MRILRQPNEVFSLIFDVTGHALQLNNVALGTGPTSKLWQPGEVFNNVYNAGKLNVGTVAAGTFQASLSTYQVNEILRLVYDPSVNAIRVAKVSTGGGPIAGRHYQLNEIFNGCYDPTAKALRVVSVSAGSGPQASYRQVDEILALVYDPVAHALQEVGV